MTTTPTITKVKHKAINRNQMNNTTHKPSFHAITVIDPSSRKSYIFVKNGKTYEKIFFSDIIYLKASGSYCDLITKHKQYVISSNLSNTISQFDGELIKRCHRSFAINIDNILAFDDSTLSLVRRDETIILPLSISYRSQVLETLPRLLSN